MILVFFFKDVCLVLESNVGLVEILYGIILDVVVGEILGFIGLLGLGKFLLLMLMGGLECVSFGMIIVLG